MMNSNTSSSNSSLNVILFLCITLVMLCLCSSSASSIPNDDGSNYLDKLPSQDEAIELFLNDDDDSNYLDKLPSQDEAIELFLKWKKEQGREYRDLEEMAKRFEIFLSTLKRITEHNANRKSPSSYVLGLTKFADWSHEEFIEKYLHKRDNSIGCCLDDPTNDKPADEPNGTTAVNNSTCVAPSSLDWRLKGAVTDVKHQNRPNKCDSCWAFSAAGAIEGIYAIKKKKPAVSLSTQELVDCDNKSSGCTGGSFIKAFKWVISNKGIASDKDYPYIAKQDTCKASKVKTSAAIDGYNKVPKTEKDLLCAVVNQPISVCVDVLDELKNYKTGVYNNKNCGPPAKIFKHGMLIVGYDTAPDGTKYWIVKNSWSTAWGINGYMHIARNTSLPLGVCNINNLAVAPTII